MATFIIYAVWLINKAISIYMLAIVVYALMSWFPNAYGTAFGRFATIGMISLAPIVALAVLSFVQMGVSYLGQLLVGY